jgi:hypothetical protein
MTIDECAYAATLPDTTNGADRVQRGLEYSFEYYEDLLRRLADDPPDKPDKDHDLR